MRRKFTPEQIRNMGARIRSVREKIGLSQEQLGKKAGFPSAGAVEMLERGFYMPRWNRLQALAKILGVSEAYIIMGDINNKKEKKMESVISKPFNTEHAQALATVPAPAPVPEETIKNIAGAAVPVESDAKKEAAGEGPVGGSGTKRSVHFHVNGDLIRKLREEAGLSQRDVAGFCGLTGSSLVGKWEHGINTISGKHVSILAEHFNVPVDTLIGAEAVKKEKDKKMDSQYFRTNGEKLKALRTKEGLSLKDVAELCQIDAGTVCQWEKGKRRITTANAELLARRYGVTVKELLAEDAPSYTQPGSPQAAKERIVSGPPVAASSTVAKELEIPENPEERFCKNISYRLYKAGCDEAEFDKAVGCDPEFFNQALEHHYKLPLGVVVNAAKFFGKTVEELVCEDITALIDDELQDLKKKAKYLEWLVKG